MSAWDGLNAAAQGLMSLTVISDAEPWEVRWRKLHAKYLTVVAENERLRTALDDLNIDVEEFLSLAHQAGHEEAKTWLIRQQKAIIRRQRAKLRALEAGNSHVS